MLTNIHRLMQDADNENIGLTLAVENDVMLMLKAAITYFDVIASTSKVWVIDE